MPGPSPTVSIRPATTADSAALSYICLVTADAGNSAADLHTASELPGVMYAEPYVHMPEAFGFVMVDSAKADDGRGGVVGYVLSTWDTYAYETSLRELWFPKYQAKYPLSAASNDPVPDDAPPHLRDLTPNDKHYIRTIHNPPSSGAVNLAFSPAHLHIDILPGYQRQGWGKRMIGQVVKYLREEKGLDGLWLGLDPRNSNARKFYYRIGFHEIPNAVEGVVGLRFEDWKD